MVQRYSVSLDDELASWIETKADERGVSKAKIIRDSVETSKAAGLIREKDQFDTNNKSLIERLNSLEERVETLESKHDSERNKNQELTKVLEAFKKQLVGQPPTTQHGQEAVIRVFEELLKDGPLKSKELRHRIYPEFKDKFSNDRSMWQSTQRYFDDIEGIEKIEHGLWNADPTAIDRITQSQGRIEEFE